jgi:hypothetical protein
MPRGIRKRWEAARNAFYRNLAVTFATVSFTLVRVIEVQDWGYPLVFALLLLSIAWLGETHLRPLWARLLRTTIILLQVLIYWEKLGPETLIGLVLLVHTWGKPLLAWWRAPRAGILRGRWVPEEAREAARGFKRVRRVLHGAPKR